MVVEHVVQVLNAVCAHSQRAQLSSDLDNTQERGEICRSIFNSTRGLHARSSGNAMRSLFERPPALSPVSRSFRFRRLSCDSCFIQATRRIWRVVVLECGEEENIVSLCKPFNCTLRSPNLTRSGALHRWGKWLGQSIRAKASDAGFALLTRHTFTTNHQVCQNTKAILAQFVSIIVLSYFILN